MVAMRVLGCQQSAKLLVTVGTTGFGTVAWFCTARVLLLLSQQKFQDFFGLYWRTDVTSLACSYQQSLQQTLNVQR